jgi:hypothetical protein
MSSPAKLTNTGPEPDSLSQESLTAGKAESRGLLKENKAVESRDVYT